MRLDNNRGWRIRVPATVANLGPGYDSFGLAVQRYISVDAWTKDDGVWEYKLIGEGAGEVPTDRTSLVYRAYREGLKHNGDVVPGFRIQGSCDIPLARGLGSSATAILLGLTLSQLATAGEIDRAELIQDAARIEGHPDNVAAAVLGGFVVTRRRRDGSLHARRIETGRGVRFVSAVPDIALATRDSRGVVPERVSISDALFNVHAAASMVAAWTAGDWQGVADAMDDRLHQPYRTRLIPGFSDVCDAARAAGALSVCLSGAGPSLLALTLDRESEVAAAMEQAWAVHGITSRARPIEIDENGLFSEPIDN
jgi:homoserine kinase